MKNIFTILLFILYCQRLVSEYVMGNQWIENGERYQLYYPWQKTAKVVVGPVKTEVESSSKDKYNVVCQHYDNHYSKVYILSKEEIIIDSLILIEHGPKFCDEVNLKHYISPQTPERIGAEMIYLWKDEGKPERCKARGYYVYKMFNYGKVERHTCIDVACPDKVTQFLDNIDDKFHIGVVSVTPDGIGHEMDYLDERLKLDKPTKILEFPTKGSEAKVFKLVCQEYRFSSGGRPLPPDGYPMPFSNPTIIGSIVHQDIEIVLERFKLTSCSQPDSNYMNVDRDFVSQEKRQFEVVFRKENNKCYKRKYEQTISKLLYFDEISLNRNRVVEIDCLKKRVVKERSDHFTLRKLLRKLHYNMIKKSLSRISKK